ncbi:MAG: hypothetical protein K0M50_21870 [Prolixibacteraceae bacterium]|nr:hypothetical protein [Prolixibacteraceae bacterium]
MRQYKQYNPNTKYGRRKMREQAYNNIANYTPEEKDEYNKIKFGVGLTLFFFFIILCVLIFVIAGPEALIKWLT